MTGPDKRVNLHAGIEITQKCRRLCEFDSHLGHQLSAKSNPFWPQWLVAFVTKFYKEFHSLFVLITSCAVLVLSDTAHRFEFSRIGLFRDSNADRRSILIRRDGPFWP